MDLKLVKETLDRTSFDMLYPNVPLNLISPSTRAILSWQKAYFKTYPDVDVISPESLSEYIQVRSKDTVNEDGVKLVLALVDKLKLMPSTDTYSIRDSLLETSFAGRAGKLVLDYQSGGEVDIISEMQDLALDYSTRRGLQVNQTSSIGSILDDMQGNTGIVFEGVPMFEEFTMPLTVGESICLAGRPDRGKTSLLSFLLSRGVKSCLKYLGEDRPILWLVNEGHQNKILPRIYQAMLNITLSEMYEMHNKGTLVKAYEERMGASADYIKVIPIHGKTIQDIRMITQKFRPSWVILDMVEHVGGVQGGSKTEIIGATWESMRTMAIVEEFVHIGTAQISVEGSDNLFPDYSSIAYTKTAVQGYTDRIIMMGNREIEGYETRRGLSLPKNKGKVEGKTSYPRVEFEADFDRCQFMQLS